jgi:probable rRNA maturation factor
MAGFRIYCEDGEFSAENVAALERAMEGFVTADIPLSIEFIFVDEAEIQRLNREQRNIDKVTDVLSFPSLDGIKGEEIYGADYPYEIDEEGNLLIGSVAVCCQRAREQAEEYGHSYERELHYLLVHGVMHCLGYDHIEENDKAQMRSLEEQIMTNLRILRV